MNKFLDIFFEDNDSNDPSEDELINWLSGMTKMVGWLSLVFILLCLLITIGTWNYGALLYFIVSDILISAILFIEYTKK